MGTQSDLFTLPAGPAELCFDKNEFMKVCLKNAHINYNKNKLKFFSTENIFF